MSHERWLGLSSSSFWITGAGTGFGRAIAVALGCAGGRVFLTGRRKAKLEETLHEAEGFGADSRNFCLLPADITSESEISAVVEIMATAQPPLCGVVNSAALPQRRRVQWPLSEESVDFWNEILRTNLLGCWLVTKSALPVMVRHGAVRVLFLSSEAGWANTAGFGQYNVCKAALNSLGFSMAEECAKHYPHLDVQMNVLVPGEAKTEMNQGSNNSPYTVVSMALLLLSHPKGGPNGKFFHRDGRHLEFAYSSVYSKSVGDVQEFGGSK